MPVTGESEGEEPGAGGCGAGGAAGRRPRWLHPDCADPDSALDLGICCRYPAVPLVGRAVELADFADWVLRGAVPGDGRAAPGGLSHLPRLIPGLLAQIHAVLPGLDGTAAAQLSCPVGRLSAALDRICPPGHGDPGPADPGPADPGPADLGPADLGPADLEPLRPLLAGCADALRAALRPQRKVRSAACWTRLD